jgi:tripartite-type tricarboxylate transporter receptor subunit TctC
LLPNVATFAEQGIAGYEASSWFALVAPAKTPPAAIRRIAEEFGKALKRPDVIARFRELGAEISDMQGDALGAFLKAETDKWAEVIRASGARAE